MKTKKLAHILFTVGTLALLAGGCGKKEETTEQPTEQPTTAEQPAQPTQPEQPVAEQPAQPEQPAAAAEGADYIKLWAGHEPTTEADPVEIAVQTFTVKSAQFDPANLEGGTAELELDLTSIKSNDPKRDGHLGTADYLDTGKYGKATVKISEVKKVDDDTFNAKADVSFRDQTKSFPVTFDVVEKTADSVRVKGTHEFSRLDFGVGKEPDGTNEKVAKNVKIEMQLTLKKS
jgi:polyisoprenoid-binding protein YceI